MLILYIVLIVYIVAVNFYAVIFLKSQRDDYATDESKMHSGDGKLLLTAILGGAIGLYVSMFIMRYRLKNLLLMILLPVIGALNVYFFILAFRSGYSYFVVR